MDKNFKNAYFFKNIACALLVLLLCCAVPTSASAKTVAKIGKKNYSSLQSALNAVKSGQTITLKSNINLGKKALKASRKANYTINLNHKSIKNCSAFKINNGKVTIKNGTIVMAKMELGDFDAMHKTLTVSKKAKVTFAGIKYTGEVNVRGQLTIKSGTYKDFWLYNSGNVRIINGTFNKIALLTNCNKMTIENGKFYFIGSYVDMGWCIYNDPEDERDSAILTLKGGSYSFSEKAAERIVNYSVMKIKRNLYNKLKKKVPAYQFQSGDFVII